MDILSDVKINGSLVVNGTLKPIGDVCIKQGGSLFIESDCYEHYLCFNTLSISQCGSCVDGSYPYFSTYKIKTKQIEDRDERFLIDFCEDKKSVILSSCYGPSVNLSKVSEKQIVDITVPTNCTGFFIGKTNSLPIVMGFQTDNGQLFKNVEMDYCINGQTVDCSDATEFLVYGKIQNGFSTPKTLMFSFM